MILELDVISERLKKLISFIDSELDLLKVEEKIRGRVKKQMEKSQKEYYLNEQMKAIQKELGDQEGNATEADILREKIENSGMPKSANEKAFSELNKLKNDVTNVGGSISYKKLPRLDGENTMEKAYQNKE